MTVLKPEDWFVLGDDIIGWRHEKYRVPMPILENGIYVWAPTSAVANVAIEELRKYRLKRQDSTCIFVLPKIMKHKGIGQLYKAADIVFELKSGCRAY